VQLRRRALSNQARPSSPLDVADINTEFSFSVI
jgi:hypothetical protein